MNAQEFATSMQARKEKNLRFFKQYFSEVFNSFHNYSLQKAKINLDPNTLEINLLEDDKAIYPLEAAAFNKAEAQQFSDTFRIGFMNHPLARSKAESFYRGRYAHGSIANFLEAVQPVAEAAKPYTFRHSMPQVVFLGSGLGIHIAEFLNIRDVRHCMLVEHSSDRFFASLYVTDWEDIITPYITDKTRSFIFSVGDTTSLKEEDRVFQAFGSVWNSINNNVPFMPIQTVYYIHQGDSFYTQVANRLNDEIEAYTNVWGFYDDEVNQLNQLLHNIKNGYRVIKPMDFSNNKRATIVCGNGPSIDEYMPIIKTNRDKLNVIAAGSACYTLLKNDIEPDFMVSIESAYGTYIAFKDIPSELAKKVPLIGAAQIAPKTFELFADGLLFLKGETATAQVLDSHKNIAIYGTPTSASNGALAIALELQLPNLFLVGMEFGFLDKTKTHSNTSFYYDDDHGEKWESAKNTMQKDAYLLETNSRGEVFTTPFYNTARLHAERKIRGSKRNDIINLSLGATIKHTNEYSLSEFQLFLENFKTPDDYEDLFHQLKKNAIKFSVKDINKTTKRLEVGFKKFKKEALDIIKNLEPNLDNIEATVFKLNQAIINNRDPDIQNINMFMRGITWHWLSNFYALCKEFDAERKLDVYVSKFKHYFGGFMEFLPQHYVDFIEKRTNDLSLLDIPLEEDEPDIEKWFKKIEEYKLK